MPPGQPTPVNEQLDGEAALSVSVIVAAYNAETLLPRCLTALERQTLPRSAYEIIVVDDGSTDETGAVAKDAGVSVLRIPHAGAAAARNAGVAAASGSIVVFTDADCEPTPNFLERLIEPILSDPAVSGSRGVYRTRQKGLVARFIQVEYEERYERIAHIETKSGSINALDTSYAAYRRHDFLKAGGFDIRFASAAGEDHELSFRMAEAGHVFRYTPLAAVYHWHVDSFVAYARRKFRIGYWKAFVTRQHPSYALNDSHMPQSLKVQIVLAGLLWLSLLAWLVWPGAGWLALGLGLLFVLSAIPFLRLTARRDPAVLWVALPLLFVRASASGLGFSWGLLHGVKQQR